MAMDMDGGRQVTLLAAWTRLKTLLHKLQGLAKDRLSDDESSRLFIIEMCVDNSIIK